MKKKYWLIIILVLMIVAMAGGSYYLLEIKKPSATVNSATQAQEQGQPTRPAELKGYIKSIEGNAVIIINEISTEPELTDAEKAAKKAERQSMSQEERQALKSEESSTLQKENVSIVIPVGVPIKKTIGDASGNLTEAQLSDIKEGTYISIWVGDYKTDNQTVEFVKIRNTSE